MLPHSHPGLRCISRWRTLCRPLLPPLLLLLLLPPLRRPLRRPPGIQVDAVPYRAANAAMSC